MGRSMVENEHKKMPNNEFSQHATFHNILPFWFRIFNSKIRYVKCNEKYLKSKRIAFENCFRYKKSLKKRPNQLNFFRFKIDVILEGFIMSIGGITSILIRSCLSKLVPPDEIGKSNYQISSPKTIFL